MIKYRQATIFVKVPIAGTVDGEPIDVTQDAVHLAVVVKGTEEPAEDDWQPGDWETDGDTTYARLLVGPEGDLDVDRGRYDVWGKVLDSPEIPVFKSGTLTVK